MSPEDILKVAISQWSEMPTPRQITRALESVGYRIVKADPRAAIDAVEIIKEILQRRGISRKKLCEAINTKESTLTRLFTGKTNSLNLATLNKIIAWDKAQGEAK